MWWLFATGANPFWPVQDAPDETEQTQQALAKHGAQSCCMWSPADGFYHFSDNWMQICGLMPADCFGQGWAEHWSEALKEQFRFALNDLFSANPAERIEQTHIEGEIIKGEGSFGYFKITLLKSGTGSEQKLSLLIMDFTHAHQLREEASRARQQAQRIDYSRSNFLSSMSHELRTPLNAILGFAQMLEHNDELPQARNAEYLRYIRESGEQLLTKISDLIEIANIDTRQLKLHEAVMNLGELMQTAIEMHSHTAFTRRITLRHYSSHPHLLVRADRARLIHCLSHLLDNALRHSVEGSIITLRCRASSHEGIILSVEDHGSGIPAAKLSNIRTTLHAEHCYFQTDIENVGIGLAITRELVAQHGGRLQIESDAGHGTVASIHLPPARLVSLSARVKPKALGV